MDEPATITTLPPIPAQSAHPIPLRPTIGRHSSGKKTRFILLATAVALLLVAAAFYLWRKAPPEAARLLPESDGIVYINLRPLRAATGFENHPVKHDPEYQHFIDATGIQFESDIDQAAFALHRMANPLGPNGLVAYSSIFVGRFDRARLANYLSSIAQSTEQYAGHDIYIIPVQGRTDRVAILSSSIVAVSNTPTAEQIHSILDRHRTAFLPFSGNTLLSKRYGDVPLLSSAWGIGQLAIGLGDEFKIFGFSVPLSTGATFIASLRWTGALHLRIEEIAPNATAATLSADSLAALLNIAQTAENALPNAITNPDTKSLLSSIAIDHHQERAVVTATIPIALLRQLASTPTH